MFVLEMVLVRLLAYLLLSYVNYGHQHIQCKFVLYYYCVGYIVLSVSLVDSRVLLLRFCVHCSLRSMMWRSMMYEVEASKGELKGVGFEYHTLR